MDGINSQANEQENVHIAKLKYKVKQEMSEIMTFLEIASAEKITKNSILGINNVDPKPEPNVHKNFFSHHLSIS